MLDGGSSVHNEGSDWALLTDRVLDQKLSDLTYGTTLADRNNRCLLSG
jgi:hypothetical protein